MPPVKKLSQPKIAQGKAKVQSEAGHPSPKRERPPVVKVTTVQVGEQIKVGERWYTVRSLRLVGRRKRNKFAACIIVTQEKGGMHFRANERVRWQIPNPDD